MGLRDVVLTGWIDEHPADGSDLAYLLLYPAGPGVAEGMELLAESLGMVRVDTRRMVRVPPGVAVASLTASRVALAFNGEPTAERPVTADWARVAMSRREVVLAIGAAPMSEPSLVDLDAYMEPGDRVWWGLLQVVS